MAELDARRTEVLATAARRLQRQIRTLLARKEFIALRRAAIDMQKHWRGYYEIMKHMLISRGDVHILLTLSFFLLLFFFTAQLARNLYEQMRREAASIRIQKHQRAHTARKSYTTLKASAIVIQTGLRAMAARDEFRYRRRTKAATIVQVTNYFTEIFVRFL